MSDAGGKELRRTGMRRKGRTSGSGNAGYAKARVHRGAAPLQFPGNGIVTNIQYGTQHRTAEGHPTTTERGTSTQTVCGSWTGARPANWMDGDGWLGAVKCRRCYPPTTP